MDKPNEVRLMEYLKALENKDSRARAKQILSSLAELEITPMSQECRWPRITNIIVDFSTKPHQKQLLFSAHYDVVNGSPGANDNASGAAVLLELCRRLRNTKAPVRVVFFDREESWLRTPVIKLGLLGSLYYVWKTGLKDLAAVYNLEFCGSGDTLAIWPVKPEETSLPAVREAEKAASRLGMPHKSVHIPWPFLSSDHLSFRLKGFANALTLSLFPRTQARNFENLLSNTSLFRLLTGRRPTPPEPLSFIHSTEDTSSSLNEASLNLMLNLVLELIYSFQAKTLH